MIACFRDYNDTETILGNGRMLRGTSYGVNRDFPKEITAARGRLWSDYKAFKSRYPAARVIIAFPAKLIVNGTVKRDEFPDWNSILKVTRLLHVFKGSPSQHSLDAAVNKLSEAFLSSADASFPQNPIAYIRTYSRNKPWFGPHCKHARKVYNQAKKNYNKCRTIHNKIALQRASKIYKNTLNKYITKYNKANEAKLRKCMSIAQKSTGSS